MSLVKRHDGRSFNQLRPIKITHDPLAYPVSSVLLELGNTKVMCSVTLQQGVPPFLRGKKTGWLTAEYAMLPTATPTRTTREITTMKRSGRSVEISRLIGRVLRTIIDVSVIGEQTLIVDCDVLQADGGTRAACITAASLALVVAQKRLLHKGTLTIPFVRDAVAALSVGILAGQVVLDPDYCEDSSLTADCSFIVTAGGKLIEIHGGAESEPFSWEIFDNMRTIALNGIQQLCTIMDQEAAVGVKIKEELPKNPATHVKESSMFSLKNRLTIP